MNKSIELYEDRLSDLNKTSSLSDKIRFIHSVVRDCCDYVDRIAVAIYDSKSDILETFVYSSDEENPLTHYQATLAKASSLQQIAQSGQARLVNDLNVFDGGKNEHTKRIKDQGFKSSYTLPIYHNGLFLGFVFFNSYGRNSFPTETFHVLDLFGHLISSLVTSELTKIRMMVATIQTVRKVTTSPAIKVNDANRFSHYVLLIAQGLSQKYGFDDQFIESIFFYSSMPDIVSSSLPLIPPNKAKLYTKEKYEVMKQNILAGQEIVDAILKEFGTDILHQVGMLSDMGEYQHIRLINSIEDHGQHVESIPIEARLFSVAYIFDALTSQKDYKVTWSNEEAFGILQQLAEFKVDKDCVLAIIQNVGKIKAIQERFKNDPCEQFSGQDKQLEFSMENRTHGPISDAIRPIPSEEPHRLDPSKKPNQLGTVEHLYDSFDRKHTILSRQLDLLASNTDKMSRYLRANNLLIAVLAGTLFLAVVLPALIHLLK
ncbi:MAG: HD domain-containing phosphohydrolase [Chlamydiales bacterium]